jgi:hypothetical protein
MYAKNQTDSMYRVIVREFVPACQNQKVNQLHA